MLTGGMKNARNRLKTYFNNEAAISYGIVEWHPKISLSSSDSPLSKVLPSDVVKLNPYDYTEKTNPELRALRVCGSSMQNNLQKLRKNISLFDNAILNFRRAGLTIQAIADQMGCSYSKVRVHIKDAASVASRIFGVDYCPVLQWNKV
jgi:hypothetical protein